MKYIVVLSLDLDGLSGPEALVEVLKKIDPPSLPGFTGTARIAVDPVASKIEEWLDEDAGLSG